MPTCDLSPESVEDLQSIWDFIAAENPDAADRLIDEFFAAFNQIAAWPATGHFRPDLTPRQVRFWPVRSYLVVYREHHEGAQIVAILHASRDVPSVLRHR